MENVRQNRVVKQSIESVGYIAIESVQKVCEGRTKIKLRPHLTSKGRKVFL